MEENGLFCIFSQGFKNCIRAYFSLQQNEVIELHSKIAEQMEKAETQLRELEEISYHFEQSNQFLKLKDVL